MKNLTRGVALSLSMLGILIQAPIVSAATAHALTTGNFSIDRADNSQEGEMYGIKQSWDFPLSVKNILKDYSQPQVFSRTNDPSHVYIVTFQRDVTAHKITNKVFSFSLNTLKLAEIYSEQRATQDVDQTLYAKGFDGTRLVLVRQKFETSAVCGNEYDQNSFTFLSLDVTHPKSGVKSYKIPNWLKQYGATLAADCARGQ